MAEQVVAWWGTRRTAVRRPAGPAPAELVDDLHARHRPIWAAQVRAVLAAQARITAADPQLAALAARLQDGRLLTRGHLDRLDATPGQDRRQLQADALAEYAARRRRHVEHELQALGWLARRRVDPTQLAAGYDAQHLLGCDLCGMLVPRSDPGQHVYAGEPGEICQYCQTGHLVEADQAAGVPTLTDQLATLRHQTQTAEG